MGKVTGFLEIDRQEQKYQPASDRVRHYREFTLPLSDEEIRRQASRCMDCGIPYCHGDTGCPVHNQIPDWNDLVNAGDWEKASRNLHSTNNFPEFTGRVCPAPCEEACTLNLEDAPVTIKTVEQTIADKAWEMGWIRPEPAGHKTGKTIAVIGAGPAGLAAAQQLARAGHEPHVYEREPKAGGLMRYGIPDFKMEKHLIDRRVLQLEAEGVVFHYGVAIGTTTTLDQLREKHDAVLIATGSERPREADIPGEELGGVHHAMPYLVQQNRRIGGEPHIPEQPIHAAGKHVVVIGGGDTASDCVGTAFRQGALSVTQMDIRPSPPIHEDKMMSWPHWAIKFRTSSSQAEGADREFSAASVKIIGEDGFATHVEAARVGEDRVPIPGTEFLLRADLVLIAIGFSGPIEEPILSGHDFAMDSGRRGSRSIHANTEDYKTSVDKVFAAGDARKGQSLIVWAIREGRQAARAIDAFLMGSTTLPR